MKIKYIIFIILAIIIVVALFLIFKGKKEEVEITKIKSFSLSYSQGYSINANIRYELHLDEKKKEYIAKIKPYGISEDDEKEMVVDAYIVEKIENILKEYNVEKWNGFDETDKYVLDGDSFYLSVMMENDQRINASGYMMWPENYRIVRDKISEIFMNLYSSKEN